MIYWEIPASAGMTDLFRAITPENAGSSRCFLNISGQLVIRIEYFYHTFILNLAHNGLGIRCGGGELALTYLRTLLSSPSPECP